MKKYLSLVLVFILVLSLTGCASWDRAKKDIKSDFADGLNREIIVYTATGKEMARYKGKIDLESETNGCCKFDFKGKRYIYYNCFIEVIEK